MIKLIILTVLSLAQADETLIPALNKETGEVIYITQAEMDQIAIETEESIDERIEESSN